jgi:hypothetical protein
MLARLWNKRISAIVAVDGVPGAPGRHLLGWMYGILGCCMTGLLLMTQAATDHHPVVIVVAMTTWIALLWTTWSMRSWISLGVGMSFIIGLLPLPAVLAQGSWTITGYIIPFAVYGGMAVIGPMATSMHGIDEVHPDLVANMDREDSHRKLRYAWISKTGHMESHIPWSVITHLSMALRWIYRLGLIPLDTGARWDGSMIWHWSHPYRILATIGCAAWCQRIREDPQSTMTHIMAYERYHGDTMAQRLITDHDDPLACITMIHDAMKHPERQDIWTSQVINTLLGMPSLDDRASAVAAWCVTQKACDPIQMGRLLMACRHG